MPDAVAIVEPAPYMAARELFGQAAGLKPLRNDLVCYQMAGAATFGILLDGALVGVIGFYPVEEGTEECFFHCRPITELQGRFLRLQRTGRLIIHARLQNASVRRIVALVASDNASGQRLARLAGFAPPSKAAPGGFGLWEMTLELRTGM